MALAYSEALFRLLQRCTRNDLVEQALLGALSCGSDSLEIERPLDGAARDAGMSAYTFSNAMKIAEERGLILELRQDAEVVRFRLP